MLFDNQIFSHHIFLYINERICLFFISKKKKKQLSCHIMLCCFGHIPQKIYIILQVTLDSTLIRITSAELVGMKRQVQTSAIAHELPGV